jgi:hypothetical protein
VVELQLSLLSALITNGDNSVSLPGIEGCGTFGAKTRAAPGNLDMLAAWFSTWRWPTRPLPSYVSPSASSTHIKRHRCVSTAEAEDEEITHPSLI